MTTIEFPKYTGARCLMMPYVQGDPDSIPSAYAAYRGIVASTFIRKGDVGFLTIDESPVIAGKPHRGARARYARALHTEAGVLRTVSGWGSPAPAGWGSPGAGWGAPTYTPGWGSAPSWGGRHAVTLERNTRILIASNIDDSCAVWDAEHEDTSEDGDIGFASNQYPYGDADLLKAGEVREIGIFTPHESLPVKHNGQRQASVGVVPVAARADVVFGPGDRGTAAIANQEEIRALTEQIQAAQERIATPRFKVRS